MTSQSIYFILWPSNRVVSVNFEQMLIHINNVVFVAEQDDESKMKMFGKLP